MELKRKKMIGKWLYKLSKKLKDKLSQQKVINLQKANNNKLKQINSHLKKTTKMMNNNQIFKL
jgi:hypothetical protein